MSVGQAYDTAPDAPDGMRRVDAGDVPRLLDLHTQILAAG